MDKSSFILYEEYGEEIAMLTNEDAGLLFKAIYAHETGKEDIPLSGAPQILFSIIRRRLDENRKKYRETCKARSIAGAMGGKAKKANAKPKKQTLSKDSKGVANLPDNELDLDLELDLDTERSCLIPLTPQGEDKTDGTDVLAIRAGLLEQVQYEALVREYDTEDVDELMDIIVEMLCDPGPAVKVSGKDYPLELVRGQLEKLEYNHIAYVLDNRGNSQGPVKNIKAYLRTMLFNASSSLNNANAAQAEYLFRDRKGYRSG